MENKEEYTESMTYMVDMLDNGITLTIPEQDLHECEKFGEKGNDNEPIIRFLGKNLWDDIRSYMDYVASNSVKLEITISKND